MFNKLLKPYRLAMAIAILLMLLEVVVEVWHPFLLGKLVDEGVLPGDFGAIALWGGIMIAAALLGFFGGITNTFYAAFASHGFAVDLRETLFHKTQFAPLFHVRRFSNSMWSTRLSNDVNQVQQSVFFGLRMVMRAPLVIVFSLVLAFIVDWQLSLWLLGIVPLTIAGVSVALRKGFRLFGAAQEELERTNGFVRENLRGMHLIRSFVREETEKTRFAGINAQLRGRMATALRLSEMTIPTAVFLMNLAIIATIAAASGRIRSGDLGIGEALAMVQYGMRISGSFLFVSMIITNMSRARASWVRVRALFAVEPTEAALRGGTDAAETGSAVSGATAGKPAPFDLVFRNVSFRYADADEPAVRDLTFHIPSGRMVAVMGATGAGKTAFIQLIPRVHEPTAGNILLNGDSLHDFDFTRLRSQIAYVPQETILFSGTIRDNLLWGKRDATADELVAAASAAQIHQTIMRLPEQYETQVEPGGRNLSGGQRQRLAIARALVRSAGLLLLDDSTSALDAATERALLTELRSRDTTILLVTQKISAAREADWILLLDGGRLAAQGSHADLLQSSPLYRRIAASQEKGAYLDA